MQEVGLGGRIYHPKFKLMKCAITIERNRKSERAELGYQLEMHYTKNSNKDAERQIKIDCATL